MNSKPTSLEARLPGWWASSYRISSDAKVRLVEKHYLYPDVTVGCGEQEDAGYITNPTVIIEVLSPNTEKRDCSAKFKAYKMAFPSFQQSLQTG